MITKMIKIMTMGMTMTVTMITTRVQWGASTYSGVSNWGAAWYCSTWVSIAAWSSIIQYCGLVLRPPPTKTPTPTSSTDDRVSRLCVKVTTQANNLLTNKITVIQKRNVLVFTAGVAVCVDRKICRATQRICYLNIFQCLQRLWMEINVAFPLEEANPVSYLIRYRKRWVWMYCKSESFHNISDFIVKANPITMKPQIPGFGSHLREMIVSSLLILIPPSTSLWPGVQEPLGLPVSQIGGGGYLSPGGTQGTPTHCWWHQPQPLSPTSASLKGLRSSTDIPVGTEEQD